MTIFKKKAKRGMKLSRFDRARLEEDLMSRARRVIFMVEKISTGGGGQSSGKLEIAKMTLEQAHKFMDDNNFDVQSEIPDFDKNFNEVQKKAKAGWTKRKDMPVIETEDVRKFQARLKDGNIDINKPLADDTDPKNPFPQGLSGFEAQKFMKNGLRDGSLTDDKIKVFIKSIPIKELQPIQKQVYFDTGFGATIKFGLEASKSFITSESFFIISSDKFIIDGHHRFLSGVLIDPNLKVNALMIDLPLDKLLPLSIAYGDAIGRKRNQ